MQPPRRSVFGQSMLIDAATRTNLELMRTLGGRREGSLLATIDRTVSAAGGRMLAQWVAAPLTGLEAIRERHAAVAELVLRRDLREALRDRLRGVPDMARALTRLALDRAGPRDLAAMAQGIRLAAETGTLLLTDIDGQGMIGQCRNQLLAIPAEIGEHLIFALKDDLRCRSGMAASSGRL